MKPMRTAHLLALAAALVLVANALAISLVAYNRSGMPESVLRLGARELAPLREPALADEGLPELRPRLRLAEGSGAGGPEARSPSWLDEAKLRELGARLPAAGPAGDKQRRRLTAAPFSIAAMLVLELDGDAYRQSLALARERAGRAAAALAANPQDDRLRREASQADKALAEDDTQASRLFAVDAGLDAVALRARYPNRARHAIVHGRIGAMMIGEPGHQRIASIVEDTGANSVSIPAEHVAALDRLQHGDAEGTVEIAFGRRLEPWIRGLSMQR